jgi:hypothetical protein
MRGGVSGHLRPIPSTGKLLGMRRSCSAGRRGRGRRGEAALGDGHSGGYRHARGEEQRKGERQRGRKKDRATSRGIQQRLREADSVGPAGGGVDASQGQATQELASWRKKQKETFAETPLSFGTFSRFFEQH